MTKTFVLFLSIIVISVCNSQDTRFCGNWNACGYWGMNYYTIKKSHKVKWYSSGCTDRGSKHHGTWTSNGDTITITSDKKHIQFILKEGKLCSYSEDGNHGDAKYGISKTKRSTVKGAVHQCRKERRRKRTAQ